MTHYKTTTDGRIDWPELSAEERELLKARTRPTPEGGEGDE